MSWLTSLPVIAQIVAMLIKGYFEKDAEKKKAKEGLRNEAKEAIKSGDLSRINHVFDKLRK